jgi:GTPase SAR1 family protein
MTLYTSFNDTHPLGDAIFSVIATDSVNALSAVITNDYIENEAVNAVFLAISSFIGRDFDFSTSIATGAAAYVVYVFKYYNIDLLYILLDDIFNIKNNKHEHFHNDVKIYGEIWDNFQKALKNIGCEYWGNLYNNTFKNKFYLDRDALADRLSVPREIQKQGAKAVADYLTNVEEQGTVYIQRETRLIILGSAGAGKSTLTRRLNGDASFPHIKDTTHGVDTNVKLDLDGIKTHVWDFGGQVIYHASHKCFISENCMYILVVNARTEDNRDANRIKYWLDTIRIYSGGNAKVFIIINESDERELDVEDYDSFKYGEYESLVHNIYSFNIGSDMNSIANFKKDLTAYIEAVGHQVFGKNDANVIKEINALFEQGEQIIDTGALNKILKYNGIEKGSDQERAKRLFDTLGIALGYNFMKGYVLDPYWISHGVYKVIDYLQKKKSIFINYNELEEVFEDERGKYPPGKREYILDLMWHHKIGFSNKNGIRGLIVPCVAAQFKPKNIIIDKNPDCLITYVEREDLEEFPADFFYRYMCANEEDIKKYGEKMALWQTGMVLAKGNASALVELIENRRIEITVWGEEKDEYSQKMQSLVNDLLVEYRFISYKGNSKKGNKVVELITLVLESIAKGATKAALENGASNIIKP